MLHQYRFFRSPSSVKVNRGKFAPAGRGRPVAAVWQIFAALLGRVIRGELCFRRLDAGEEIPPRRVMMLHH
jgi:hypothetical protein